MLRMTELEGINCYDRVSSKIKEYVENASRSNSNVLEEYSAETEQKLYSLLKKINRLVYQVDSESVAELNNTMEELKIYSIIDSTLTELRIKKNSTPEK